MKRIAAKDVMTRWTLAVEAHTPIYDAIKILVENGISGLPVVGENLQLIGILTEKDVLTLLRSRQAEGKCVDDFMSRAVISFDQEEDITTICDALTTHGIRRVPITAEGRLIGIVSRRDIIRLILEEEGILHETAQE
jgi:CBS domain-containing protein